MLDNGPGKLLIFASIFALHENRLRAVSMATEKMAKLLKTRVEVKRVKKNFTPIYVYYENSGDEPIPIFCSNGKELNSQEVYSALRKMIFVLSFHPRHFALKHVRDEIIPFS